MAVDTTPYHAIIDELNGLINHYNTAVTQRLAGRSTDNELVEDMVVNTGA